MPCCHATPPSKRRFHLLILDEAQNIKNATTKAAVAARERRHGIACA